MVLSTQKDSRWSRLQLHAAGNHVLSCLTWSQTDKMQDLPAHAGQAAVAWTYIQYNALLRARKGPTL